MFVVLALMTFLTLVGGLPGYAKSALVGLYVLILIGSFELLTRYD